MNDIWEIATDESLLNVDTFQHWITEKCAYRANVEPEKVQRAIALGRTISLFQTYELIPLLMIGDASEVMVVQAELRARWLADMSAEVARIVWAMQDHPEVA